MATREINPLPAKRTPVFGSHVIIEANRETSQEFSNGRVLTLRAFEGAAIRGFTVALADVSHRLMPRCTLQNYMDDEGRLSAEIKLAFGKIPKTTIWGNISSSIMMRSYAVHIPKWRLDDDWYKELKENASRDKVTMNSNTECLVDEPDRFGNAFKMQNLVNGVSKIADEIWNPCLEFSMAAANSLRNGLFPDFSELNELEPLTGKTYHSTDQVLSYRGSLKPAECHFG